MNSSLLRQRNRGLIQFAVTGRHVGFNRVKKVLESDIIHLASTFSGKMNDFIWLRAKMMDWPIYQNIYINIYSDRLLFILLVTTNLEDSSLQLLWVR